MVVRSLHTIILRNIAFLGLCRLQATPRAIQTVGRWGRRAWKRSSGRYQWLDIDIIRTTVPVRQAMVETERLLSVAVHGHLMSVLATHLCEGTSTFMDPLVAKDLLTTAGRMWIVLSRGRSHNGSRRRRTRSRSNNCINLMLGNVSNLISPSITKL
jgi:hypothetical protein